ncbi:hypothetical protein WN944_002115 [Citrus x changshan-huyou]|uniref:Endoplasmic reticulum transmembrane protein n=1 Tax=Citrus x changshan-huyou TaxID=2935761 RepID=A0AAP0MKQ7_9ROSI
MALILTLLFRNPLRKFVIMGLDRLKRGRGPLVAKSVGATVLVVLCSAVYSAVEIQRRAREGGAINPTDEVLKANLVLQASLMDMFYLFFTTVFTEMALILALLFESPLRKLLILGLDKLKQGRGPLVAKSVGATVLVVLSSAVYNVVEIHKRSRESGALNPTEEVLMADLLLEASLMGENSQNKSVEIYQKLTSISDTKQVVSSPEYEKHTSTCNLELSNARLNLVLPE